MRGIGCIVIAFCLSISAHAGEADTARVSQTGQEKAGKWNGNFSLEGGSNFNMTPQNQSAHHRGDLSAEVGYTAPTFAVLTSLASSYHYLLTSVIGRDSSTTTTGKQYALDGSADEIHDFNINAGIKTRWTPNKRNTYNFSYSYGHNDRIPNVGTISYSKEAESTLKSSFSRKHAENFANSHNVLFGYRHLFTANGGVMNADLGFSGDFSNENSEWITGDRDKDSGSVEVSKYRYRDTPSQDALDGTAGVKYTENNFCGVRDLDFDASVLVRFHRLDDHKSAATYVDGVWKDSTQARENFCFRTSTLLPKVHINYRPGFYELDFSYAPEFYLKRLDGDGNTGSIDRGEVAHLVSFSNIFKPAEGHNIFLNGTRNEERPDYLQICWFPRQSRQYSNELYKGNQDLRNTARLTASLGYEYSVKQLSVRLSGGYIYSTDMIEQTYSDTTVYGKNYRVYTWINGGKSHEVNAIWGFSWNGSKFQASFEAGYNFYKGVTIGGDVTTSGEFRMKTALGYTLKTWRFGADLTYVTDQVRLFTTLKSIAECNALVSKSFGPFTVKLEGRNLLDREIEKVTTSEDMSTTRSEKITNNKRLFVLGLAYSF